MNKFSRISVLLLCIVMLLSLIPNAYGAEMTDGEKATYVLNHQVDGDNYSGPALQYFSPYRIACTLDKKSITMKNCVFALYNTTNDTVIPAYCSDISVLANANYSYRRINLEDSTFAAEAAGLIRAIVYNGFYLSPIEGETDAEHELRVEEELKRLGEAAGVEDLTIGEAITGTQAAIWQAAHSSSMVYTDFLLSMYMTDVSDSVRYYDICNEERYNGHVKYNGIQNDNAKIDAASDRRVGSRIQAVYTYLMSLEPMAPMDSVVSPASFVNLDGPYAIENGNGTFDMKVTVTVNVHMEEGDSLTLTASLGDKYKASAALTDGTQTVTLILSNVPDELRDESVLLEIAGQQSGFDVYLFDADGDRNASQSMVGMVDCRLPVYTSISAPIEEGNNDRILNFYKTTLVPNGTDEYEKVPLEGITFDIFFVAKLSDYLMGRVQLPDAKDYDHPEISDFTLITGTDGKASLNLTQKGMPDGVYLVVEREHPAIKAPVDPFYVVVPTTNPEGTGYIYEINIQPKNDIKGLIKIEKDVITLGNDSASVDAYKDHTWIIGTNIPEDIANGKSFVISDTLDPRLDYIGNMKVQIEAVDGQTVLAELTAGTDYTVTVTDVDSLAEGTPSDAFTVSLTRLGMGTVATAIGENSYDDYMLRVYFDAQINANSTPATEIPNEAYLDYTNSVNFDFSAKSDKPVVYTGGAKLLKTDYTDATIVLPGAEFEVYRMATEDEILAGENLVRLPGYASAMVKVPFFDNEALAGDKVTTATTDENGELTIYGLSYGTYYLRETKAPAGYNLPNEPIEITIDAQSHMEENVIVVGNISGTILPGTGGSGTNIYILLGLLLLSLSAVLLLKKSRTNEV